MLDVQTDADVTARPDGLLIKMVVAKGSGSDDDDDGDDDGDDDDNSDDEMNDVDHVDTRACARPWCLCFFYSGGMLFDVFKIST